MTTTIADSLLCGDRLGTVRTYAGLDSAAGYTIPDTGGYSDGVFDLTFGILCRGGAYVDSINWDFGLHVVPGGVLFQPVQSLPDAGNGIAQATDPVFYDGRRRVPLATFLPLFHYASAISVIDSVLYYWGFRAGGGDDDWFYAGRYQFRIRRADTLFLFRDQLEATEILSLGYPPILEAGFIKYQYTPQLVAWVDRDFRLVDPPGRSPEIARGGRAPPDSATGADIAFVSISAGPRTCAVTTTGQAYCWGSNGYGGLGNGTTVNSVIPVAVSGQLVFESVSAAGNHTCGLTTAALAYCWGLNEYGQFGNGTAALSAPNPIPLAVSGGLTFRSIDAGSGFTCGVTTAGTAYCWGSNGNGALGDGTTTGSTIPRPVSGGLSFRSVSTGGGHACGVTSVGTAYCWGRNSAGQLGNPTAGFATPTPVQAFGGLTFESVSAGGDHTCGVAIGGAAHCWGESRNGALGDGTVTIGATPAPARTTARATPVAVSGGLTFRSISAGEVHTCGVTTAEKAYCWGFNRDGQLGNGTTASSATPQPVSGGLTFRSVDAGYTHTCGVTTAGEAYCWGDNHDGALGDGTTLKIGAQVSRRSVTPVRVSRPAIPGSPPPRSR